MSSNSENENDSNQEEFIMPPEMSFRIKLYFAWLKRNFPNITREEVMETSL